MNLHQNKQKQQVSQRAGVLGSNRFRLAFCAAALMILTSCVFSPPSKDKVVAYVEKEFGKTPEILSVKRKKRGKTVIYEMRLEGEELIFTVDSMLFNGNYGPQTWINDHYDQAVIDSRIPEAELLAEKYGLSVRRLTGGLGKTVAIVLHDEEQAADAVNLYLDLFQLFPLKPNSRADCSFLLLRDGEEEFLETLSFSWARRFFEETEIKSTQKYFENPDHSVIKRALYEEWKVWAESL